MLKELPGLVVDDVLPVLNSLLEGRADGIFWAVPEASDSRACLGDPA
jgi:hypothetical protein